MEEYKDVLGKDVIGSFTPIEGTTWGLVMEHSSAIVLDAVYKLRTLFILIILVAAFLVVFLAILISRNITKPILQIARVSQKIARGEIPEETIKINRKDEINLLAQSFQEIVDYFKEIAENFHNAR